MIRFISGIAMVLGLSSVGHAIEAQSTNEIMKLLSGAMMSAQPEWGQPCGRSSECAFGESCVNYICQVGSGPSGCIGDYQCPVGERCYNGVCRVSLADCAEPAARLTCISSADCTPGETCIHGQCGMNSCISDVECPFGEHCYGGICHR